MNKYTVVRLEDEELQGETSSGGVQAVETGIRLLEALIELGPTSMLKTLAEKSGMSPPKAHRYLSSYCKVGLVERYGKTGGYRLGPLALQIGLAALRHLDVVSLATPAVIALRDKTGFTTALSVWGSYGPTFVKLAESFDLVVVTTRPGTVMPLLTSSAGKMFGAYLPRSTTERYIAKELRKIQNLKSLTISNQLRVRTIKDVDEEFEQVRRDKMSFNTSGEYRQGINALTAPVFDHDGQLGAAITIWGEAAKLDMSKDGPIANLLRKTTFALSQQMGG